MRTHHVLALHTSLCLAALLPLASLAQSTPPASAASGAAPSAAPAATGVYKWKDASGRWHYGDQPPSPKADPMKLRVHTPTEAETQAARARLEAMQADSAAKAAQQAGAGAPPSGRAPAGSGPLPGESACEAKWREYNESYACFDPYRVVGGGIKAEAFQKCKVVKQPEPCP
ncbi:hypothetical protein CCO03_04240 [Comamonas serinivorans]|uniref:DUF4124 domain-containing protein n=1 Tax=Comamonas serinivorans TaxID=1082851 RepID=A0A1Y0EKN5_9BURK|nr:DUF4124 domain-containing protein [Comamonas serinivorans]ARU03988.1 hypothetical protein CCO03_04240 [Comamonas serinivorans]